MAGTVAATFGPAWARMNEPGAETTSRPERSTAPSSTSPSWSCSRRIRTSPGDIIGILVASGFVFWLAHVYAFLIPRIAADGRLRVRGLVETAKDQIGILWAAAIPIAPLAVAALGPISDRTGYRAAIAAGLAALAAFSLRAARAGGLPWARALALAGVLLIAGMGLLFLEVSLH